MMLSWHLYLQKSPGISRIPISWYQWIVHHSSLPGSRFLLLYNSIRLQPYQRISLKVRSVRFPVIWPATATGTVTFNEGSTPLGTASLSSGKASYSTSGRSVGEHSISATYGGDSNVAGSTSSAFTQTVNSAPVGDFSLSATPLSKSVTAGSGTTCTVSITRSSGFTGPVTFSVSKPADGVPGTFKPITTTGTSSKLSITTSSSTPPGTYTLTITGTSNSLIHKTTVTLIVKPRSR